MAYLRVPSATDLGPAKGPRLAMVWHMAEGGGTVGYLSRPNPNGVSVHFVIEYSGRIVQMLDLDHMHSSIRTSDIRTTDDPDGFYGATAARAVMGEWADTRKTLGPNHASIGVEMEGFADSGPRSAQIVAMGDLYDDMVHRYPGIRSLGHRDFADYKACPGKHIPWTMVGGHGAEMMDWKITDGWPGTFTCTTTTGAGWINPDTFAVKPMPQGTTVNVIAHAYIGGRWKQAGYLGSDATVHGRLVLAGDGTFVPSLPCPPADCSDVKAQLTIAEGRIQRAITALGGQ